MDSAREHALVELLRGGSGPAATDLGEGRHPGDRLGSYVHLLYKYAGAGQCGLLMTYSSEAWGTPFIFWEARERTCDEEPCDDGTCYDPLTWDLAYQTGASG